MLAKLRDTLIAITEHLSGLGFAFAQVTPRGDRNFETRTIAVIYSVDQGPRTYVQRIEIRGNTRTRDYVIRREFDIFSWTVLGATKALVVLRCLFV